MRTSLAVLLFATVVLTGCEAGIRGGITAANVERLADRTHITLRVENRSQINSFEAHPSLNSELLTNLGHKFEPLGMASGNLDGVYTPKTVRTGTLIFPQLDRTVSRLTLNIKNVCLADISGRRCNYVIQYAWELGPPPATQVRLLVVSVWAPDGTLVFQVDAQGRVVVNKLNW